MRKCLLLMLFAVAGMFVHAQSPVKWEFSAKKVKDKTYEVHMTAVIAEPWNIYSQTTPDGGPVATKIEFKKNPLVLATGNVQEVGNMKKKYEDVFEIDVHYYKQKVDFVQLVTVKSAKNIKTNLAGSVEFMACNNNQCLPPQTINFTVALN